MKERKIEVICQYGTEDQAIHDILLQSFLLFVQQEIQKRSHILAAASTRSV